MLFQNSFCNSAVVNPEDYASSEKYGAPYQGQDDYDLEDITDVHLEVIIPEQSSQDRFWGSWNKCEGLKAKILCTKPCVSNYSNIVS